MSLLDFSGGETGLDLKNSLSVATATSVLGPNDRDSGLTGRVIRPPATTREIPGKATPRGYKYRTRLKPNGAKPMSDVTHILSQIESGDPSAAELLLPLIYKELRNLAAAKMAHESPDHTLQATALVHEAYLRLVDTSNPQAWKHRGHFFVAAAESMRRILIESARRRTAEKRGGGADHEQIGDVALGTFRPSEELIGIHEVLDKLAVEDHQSADLVKLRHFAGMNMDEAAGTLGISTRKAYHVWAYARSWLRRELGDG